jgi:hypothetical protein
VFELHAGAAYRDFGVVDGLRQRGATAEVPAAGQGPRRPPPGDDSVVFPPFRPQRVRPVDAEPVAVATAS